MPILNLPNEPIVVSHLGRYISNFYLGMKDGLFGRGGHIFGVSADPGSSP